MTQIILDEQLHRRTVLIPIRSWTTAERIKNLYPGQVIKDERIPQLLHALKQPTFITIDSGFWNKNLRHQRYCIIYFALQDNQQNRIPHLLRRLLRLDTFKTRAARMGKIARVRPNHVDYWQWSDEERHTLSIPQV